MDEVYRLEVDGARRVSNAHVYRQPAPLTNNFN